MIEEKKWERLNTQSEERSKTPVQESNSINPNLPRNKMSQRSIPSKSSISRKKTVPVNTKKEARRWNEIDSNITNQDIDKFDE